VPLVSSPMEKAIEDALKAQLSPDGFADKLASAYNDYASLGMAGPALPILTGGEKSAFKQAFLGAISDPGSGSPDKAGGGLAAAVTAFWIAPPVNFAGGPATGMATVIAGVGALPSDIASVLGNTKNTEADTAKGMAKALDTATKTVMVALIIPPAGPVPTPLS
jgi:hypothetical protein